jgi:hypothetical protein
MRATLITAPFWRGFIANVLNPKAAGFLRRRCCRDSSPTITPRFGCKR